MGLIRLFSGTDIQVAGGSCRTENGAEKARNACSIPIQVGNDPNIPPATDVVWIATPDEAIASCAAHLWGNELLSDTTTLIHSSGALPATLLRENAPGVASVARAHPLQSFAPVELGENQGKTAHWFIEGEAGGELVAMKLLQSVGAHTHPFPEAGGLHYHTAASLASNGLVALTSVAATLAEEAGVSKEKSLEILLPLMRGTLDNLENIGLPQALTGPIARGDRAVVQGHLDNLKTAHPMIGEIYRALGMELISIAQAQGHLSEEDIEALTQIIETRN